MIRTICAAIVYLAWATIAHAQVQPPLEVYGSLPRIGDMAISPDGTRFAYLITENGTNQVIVKDFAGQQQPVGLNMGVPVRNIEFISNRYLILTASTTRSADAIEYDFEYSAAFTIDIDSALDHWLMVDTPGLSPFQSGLGSWVGIDPQTGHLLMPAFMIVGQARADMDLLSNPPDSGEGDIVKRGRSYTVDWFVNEDGDVVAREDFNEQNGRHTLHSLINGSRRIFLQSVERPETSFVGLTLDQQGLVYFGSTEENQIGTMRVMGFDGEDLGAVLLPGNQSISRIIKSNNRTVLGVQFSGVEPAYHFFVPEMQAAWEALSGQLRGVALYLYDWDDTFNRLIFRAFEGQTIDTYILYDAKADSISILSPARNGIPDEAIAPVAVSTFQARDGLEIEFLLTLPPGMQATRGIKLPTIMLPHGGPAAYDRFDFDWMAQFLANRGYLVMQPNFRGSAGYGDDFLDAGYGEWGGKMQDDVTDGLKFLVDNELADPDRVCIMGASYGGYSALAGGAFTPELYRCVISVNGVSDLDRFIDYVRDRRGRRDPATSYWEEHIASGDARGRTLDPISPFSKADAFQAPVLLIHGENDTVVPFQQSQIMERALNRADKSVTLQKLDGEDHWLSRSETRIAMLRAVDDFLSENNPAN